MIRTGRLKWSTLLLLFLLVNPARAAGSDLPALDWDDGSLDPEAQAAIGEAHELMLQKLESTQGVKLFWWNIENGGTDQRISTGGCPAHAADHPLEHNLVELARSSAAPDVIGLSEYDPSDPNGLQPWVTAELLRLYPYHAFYPYLPDGSWTEGIGVFSKLPLAPRPREELDWAPGASPEARENNRRTWLEKHPESRGF